MALAPAEIPPISKSMSNTPIMQQPPHARRPRKIISSDAPLPRGLLENSPSPAKLHSREGPQRVFPSKPQRAFPSPPLANPCGNMSTEAGAIHHTHGLCEDVSRAGRCASAHASSRSGGERRIPKASGLRAGGSRNCTFDRLQNVSQTYHFLGIPSMRWR